MSGFDGRSIFRIVIWHLVDDDTIRQELPLLLAFLCRIFRNSFQLRLMLLKGMQWGAICRLVSVIIWRQGRSRRRLFLDGKGRRRWVLRELVPLRRAVSVL